MPRRCTATWSRISYGDIDAVKTGSDGSKWFFTRDPEGNRVEFYQSAHASVPREYTDIRSARASSMSAFW